jgi:sterol desaturase/sphingolipid hydroxylase (fatty acid hydroxylase superfamily)
MHFYTYIVWGNIRIGNGTYAHSGYDFPFFPLEILPFYSNSTYHDFHHSKSVGNYAGIFSLWDTLNGTNKIYYKSLEMKVKKSEGKTQRG